MCAPHQLEQAGQDQACQREQGAEGDDGLDEGKAGAEERTLRRPGEERHEEDHRNQREILEEQDGRGRLPLGGIDDPLVFVDLEDDRRARKGQQEAHEQRHAPIRAEELKGGCREEDRESDLQQPGAEHAGEDEADPHEREFDPDAEQEQSHTQLGKILDGVGRRYPGEPSRSCEQPGQEIGDDRRKPEPSADEEAAGGDREQDEDLGRSHARVPWQRLRLRSRHPSSDRGDVFHSAPGLR